MIITQTPVRISFFGGGTDYPAFFREHGGEVLSASIDHYTLITVHPLTRFSDHNLFLAKPHRNEYMDDGGKANIGISQGTCDNKIGVPVINFFLSLWKKHIDKLQKIDDNTRMLRIDRDAYRYVEYDRSLLVGIELQWGAATDVIFYKSAIKRWLPPHELELIDDAERERIAAKIEIYLRSQRITYKIE